MWYSSSKIIYVSYFLSLFDIILKWKGNVIIIYTVVIAQVYRVWMFSSFIPFHLNLELTRLHSITLFYLHSYNNIHKRVSMKRNSNVKYAQNPPCFSKVLIREPCLEHYYTLEKKNLFSATSSFWERQMANAVSWNFSRLVVWK